MHFDALSEQDVVERVIEEFLAGHGGRLVTPNVDILRLAVHNPRLQGLLTGDLTVADGMPIVWASRLAGCRLPERVAGSTLVLGLCRAAAQRGVPVFLLGGSPNAAELAAIRLRRDFSGLRVGFHSPPFGFEQDAEASARLEQTVEDFGPALYFCGLGAPKQEQLMAQLSRISPPSWFMGCGAAIGYLAGEQQRAPKWMQNTGLEWVHRLRCEPRRLFHRYVIDDIPFAIRLLSWSAVEGLRHHRVQAMRAA